jgi:hypothetical protein
MDVVVAVSSFAPGRWSTTTIIMIEDGSGGLTVRGFSRNSKSSALLLYML